MEKLCAVTALLAHLLREWEYDPERDRLRERERYVLLPRLLSREGDRERE